MWKDMHQNDQADPHSLTETSGSPVVYIMGNKEQSYSSLTTSRIFSSIS